MFKYFKSTQSVSSSYPHMAQSESENPQTKSDEGLEYCSGDDAWYNIQVSLHSDSLKIKYSKLLGSPKEEFHDVRIFKSLDDVVRFRSRFRTLSAQVQDSECRSVVPGVKVCASYRSNEDDLRYYDAVVDQVDHIKHSFDKGEEQCLCKFILFWEHGPGAGLLTTATVGDICLHTDGEIDQALAEFFEKARMMVISSNMHSGSPLQASNGDLSLENQSRESGDKKLEIACNQSQTTGHKYEEYREPTTQDTDLGGEVMTLKRFLTSGYSYGVAVNNLEKDLTPLTMTKFIFKETAVQSRALIFPSLLADTFTRGIIEVNSRVDFVKLNDFLENTNHIIVSSHNRPWVVTESLWKGEVKTIKQISGGEHIHSAANHSGLKLVQSGTREYDIAKLHKENFLEFYSHVKCMVERLTFEEQRISSGGLVSEYR